MVTPLEQTYYDSAWIRGTLINRFKGGLLEENELESIANETFFESYLTHDPKKSDFSSWCFGNIRNRIIDELRKKQRQLRKIDSGFVELDLFGSEPFDSRKEFFEWISQLNPDCQFIVGIVINKYPKKVKEYLEFYRKENPDTIRNAIREYLIKDLKWKKERVQKQFLELKHQLMRRKRNGYSV